MMGKEFLRVPINQVNLLGYTISVCLRTPPDLKMILNHLYNIGNRSLVFICVTLGFLGMISVYQTCTQALKVVPDLSLVGAVFIQIMVREFGPTVTGLMIATRVGAGIAAEIGSMVVTDQIDAMKVCNTDPVEYVVVPKFVACICMSFILTAFGILVAVVSGLVVAVTRFQINPDTFLSLRLTTWSDFIIGISKALVFGISIPIISAESGFRTSGGAQGVGWATTRAVVNSSFAVIVLDFVISTIGYLFT